ncbi:hypothetical protein [Polycladidibacter hongkongensis]|uniref:hypothetical protein n=1 Tax=Polycladidibacter hongkongensis TaxID=1647556 RepID=UPI00083721F5|nr:hypothetical protein [Pseudovibrio hongkongensis]
MFTLVLSVKQNETDAAKTLASVVPACARGLVTNAVILQASATPTAAPLADTAGAVFHCQENWTLSQASRRVNEAARSSWVFWMQSGVILEGEWDSAVESLISRLEMAAEHQRLGGTLPLSASGFSKKQMFYQRLWRLAPAFLGRGHPSQPLVMHRALLTELATRHPAQNVDALGPLLGRRAKPVNASARYSFA